MDLALDHSLFGSASLLFMSAFLDVPIRAGTHGHASQDALADAWAWNVGSRTSVPSWGTHGHAQEDDDIERMGMRVNRSKSQPRHPW